MNMGYLPFWNITSFFIHQNIKSRSQYMLKQFQKVTMATNMIDFPEKNDVVLKYIIKSLFLQYHIIGLGLHITGFTTSCISSKHHVNH